MLLHLFQSQISDFFWFFFVISEIIIRVASVLPDKVDIVK